MANSIVVELSWQYVAIWPKCCIKEIKLVAAWPLSKYGANGTAVKFNNIFISFSSKLQISFSLASLPEREKHKIVFNSVDCFQRQMLLRWRIKWSKKYKLRPLMSRLVGHTDSGCWQIIGRYRRKQNKPMGDRWQQTDNKRWRKSREAKTKFTTAVMLVLSAWNYFKHRDPFGSVHVSPFPVFLYHL